MSPRILLVAPLALAAAAGAVSGGPQYDVSIRGTAFAVMARQGPSGMDAHAETRDRDITARLTLTTDDSAGVRAVSARLDTLILPLETVPPGAELRGREDATGSTWRGTATDRGAVLRLATTGPSSARLLDEPLILLLPRLPGSGRSGGEWSDTTRFEIESGPSRSSGRIVSDYRIVGGDAREGFRVERSFRGERTTRAKGADGEVLIESRMQGTAAYALDGAGGIASARIVRRLSTDMHLPHLELPVSAETSDTIEVARR